MVRTSLLGLLVLTASGCFSFAESNAAPIGSTARVTLPVMERVADGSDRPMLVEGVVVESSLGAVLDGSGGISLEQKRKERIGNFREVESVDTLWVPQPDVRRLEVRRFSWARSTLGSVVLGMLGYVIYDRFDPDRNPYGR